MNIEENNDSSTDLRELLTQEVEKSSSAPLEPTAQAAETPLAGSNEPQGDQVTPKGASSTEEGTPGDVKPVESTHPKEEDERTPTPEAVSYTHLTLPTKRIV